MKLTKSKLQKIITEELGNLVEIKEQHPNAAEAERKIYFWLDIKDRKPERWETMMNADKAGEVVNQALMAWPPRGGAEPNQGPGGLGPALGKFTTALGPLWDDIRGDYDEAYTAFRDRHG